MFDLKSKLAMAAGLFVGNTLFQTLLHDSFWMGLGCGVLVVPIYLGMICGAELLVKWTNHKDKQ